MRDQMVAHRFQIGRAGNMRRKGRVTTRGQSQMHLRGAATEDRCRVQIERRVLARFWRDGVRFRGGRSERRETSPRQCSRNSDPVLRASTASRRLRSAPVPAAARGSAGSSPSRRTSMDPPKGGTLEKLAVSVRKRPISTSGFCPGCWRRNSFRMSRSPRIAEVLLCSAAAHARR